MQRHTERRISRANRAARVCTLIGALCAALCTPSCAPGARAIGPTVEAQRQAIDAIALAYSDDMAMSEAMLRALLDIQRTLLEGRLHRELIIRGYLDHDLQPDHDALARDLERSKPVSTLAQEVILAEMTARQAHDWLDRYADAPTAEARRELLETLSITRNRVRAESAILTANRSRNASITRLFDDAHAASNALGRLSGPPNPPDRPETRARAREIFDRVIAEHIDDPEKRAAARELLEAIFDISEGTSQQNGGA